MHFEIPAYMFRFIQSAEFTIALALHSNGKDKQMNASKDKTHKMAKPNSITLSTNPYILECRRSVIGTNSTNLKCQQLHMTKNS